MAKRSSSGVPSPPKPPKLTLPKPSQRPWHPKPASLKQAQLAPRPYQPKPVSLAKTKLAGARRFERPGARLMPPKPVRLEFPKPYTSDSLTVIPRMKRPKLPSSPKFAAASAASKTVSIPRASIPTAKIAAAVKVSAPKKVPVKVVLWISSYPALLATTKLMLEPQGFEVHSASDFLQVQSACKEDRFQLAIVDHTLAPKIKRAIAAVIREKRAGTLILELCQVSSEIPDADYLLIGHEPEALVNMVLRIARERSA